MNVLLILGQNNPLSGTGFHHGMGKGSREVTLMHGEEAVTYTCV